MCLFGEFYNRLHQVLNELNSLSLENDTLVVLHSDQCVWGLLATLSECEVQWLALRRVCYVGEADKLGARDTRFSDIIIAVVNIILDRCY